MTRKDYELIAAALHHNIDFIEADYRAFKDAPNVEGQCLQFDMLSHRARLYGARLAAFNMASALATANPRFDRTRFLKACGIN